MTPGLFITFEGIEGCGKSTQARLLTEALRRLGLSVRLTREPGGTPIGDAIRNLLLNPAHRAMSDEAELLLYSAARAQHVREVIRPSLADGSWVVCDRFADSTRAYQGYGLGLESGRISLLHEIAVGGTDPDLTFLLDLDPSVGMQRKFSESGETPDRIEERDLEYHRRVREGFLKIAERETARVIVLDALISVEELHHLIINAPPIRERLAKV